MRRLALATAVAALLATSAPAPVPAQAVPTARPVYPAAPRGTVVDSYYGTTVPDPYRWLEDVAAPQTAAFVASENALTRRYLDAVPQRAAIRAEYLRLESFPTVGPSIRHGARWYFARNSGSQNDDVLYVRPSEHGPARVFFDPNGLSADGTVTVAYRIWSDDGRYFGYATQTAGSDWLTWHVRDAASGRDLPDTVRWSKYVEASFDRDEGFYYSGYDAPADGKGLSGAKLGRYKAFYHRLGTPQAADRVVFAPADHPDWFVSTQSASDGRYAIVYAGTIGHNGYYWRRRGEPAAALRPLIPVIGSQPGSFYVGNDGTRFYFDTAIGAPHGRIVWVDGDDPAHRMHTIVPERADALGGVSLIGNRFYLEYLHDVHSVVDVVDVRGRHVGSVALPGLGTAGTPGGRRRDRFAYYTFTSFTVPVTLYRYDTLTGRSTVATRYGLPFDAAAFVTEQLFATSKDGTRVPLFVTHRLGIPLDGSTPTLLYGYGGFGYSLTPGFGAASATWLALGGAYAVVNARGGGEYGEDWHRAGMGANKQHVFDDVIAAAQVLIERGIASPAKLALSGTSGGGLMVGAVITQRPDLFGAALPDVGPMDMLRFQKFTVGAAWTPETGASDGSAEQFRTLYAYSPYHRVREGVRYPATLITTGDHDDRVFPAHSYKFAAALQHAQAGDAPILLRVEADAGHSGAGTIERAADKVADRYAFLVANLHFTPVR